MIRVYLIVADSAEPLKLALDRGERSVEAGIHVEPLDRFEELNPAELADIVARCASIARPRVQGKQGELM